MESSTNQTNQRSNLDSAPVKNSMKPAHFINEVLTAFCVVFVEYAQVLRGPKPKISKLKFTSDRLAGEIIATVFHCLIIVAAAPGISSPHPIAYREPQRYAQNGFTLLGVSTQQERTREIDRATQALLGNVSQQCTDPPIALAAIKRAFCEIQTTSPWLETKQDFAKTSATQIRSVIWIKQKISGEMFGANLILAIQK